MGVPMGVLQAGCCVWLQRWLEPRRKLEEERRSSGICGAMLFWLPGIFGPHGRRISNQVSPREIGRKAVASAGSKVADFEK
jgi:hypothetical protein